MFRQSCYLKWQKRMSERLNLSYRTKQLEGAKCCRIHYSRWLKGFLKRLKFNNFLQTRNQLCSEVSGSLSIVFLSQLSNSLNVSYVRIDGSVHFVPRPFNNIHNSYITASVVCWTGTLSASEATQASADSQLTVHIQPETAPDLSQLQPWITLSDAGSLEQNFLFFSYLIVVQTHCTHFLQVPLYHTKVLNICQWVRGSERLSGRLC